MTSYPIDMVAGTAAPRLEPLRAGFGRGLLEAGRRDSRVVALCADLTESTMMHLFADEFPSVSSKWESPNRTW